ncbi:hypothetical protein H6G80_25000 [Nostoc sp. FACHB-87]|nr:MULTISPECIES: hypothetical protein [Nostocaceae]MBD2457321.1 hypothetical protein [Nostoc sp. FACHB-87]MBD2478390.1 hypothetical protein [Anabaena sp. FACHB-83]
MVDSGSIASPTGNFSSTDEFYRIAGGYGLWAIALAQRRPQLTSLTLR